MGVLQINEDSEVLTRIGECYVAKVILSISEANSKVRDNYSPEVIYDTTAEWIHHQYIIGDLESSVENLAWIIIGSITNIRALGAYIKKYHTNFMSIPSGYLFKVVLENGQVCLTIYLKNKQ